MRRFFDKLKNGTIKLFRVILFLLFAVILFVAGVIGFSEFRNKESIQMKLSVFIFAVTLIFVSLTLLIHIYKLITNKSFIKTIIAPTLKKISPNERANEKAKKIAYKLEHEIWTLTAHIYDLITLHNSTEKIKSCIELIDNNKRVKKMCNPKAYDLAQAVVSSYNSSVRTLYTRSFDKIYEDCNTGNIVGYEAKNRLSKLKEDFEIIKGYCNEETVNDFYLRMEKEMLAVSSPINMDSIDKMNGHDFEKFIASLLQKSGFENVEVTKGSGDQGVDVIAEKNQIKYAIQCKNYSSSLGNTPVQEVYAGAKFYGCHVGVVITNSTFTSGARELANNTGVLLWDRNTLSKMVKEAYG